MSGCINTASPYFENNKDIMAANDFASAMRLGCFDKEFLYFGLAYADDAGAAWRVSRKSLLLHDFAHVAAAKGVYPTRVRRFMRRLPCPSGQEEAIREQVRLDAARELRRAYGHVYLEALAMVALPAPCDRAADFLGELRCGLEGLYDADQLQLFEGLLAFALERKVLTVPTWMELRDWVRGQRRQMEDDIVARGQCKKTVAGFAYLDTGGRLAFYVNAQREAACERRDAVRIESPLVSPMLVRTEWLGGMGEFPAMRLRCLAEMKALFEGGWWERFERVRAMPSPIDAEVFAREAARVRDNCPPDAYKEFASYRFRWL